MARFLWNTKKVTIDAAIPKSRQTRQWRLWFGGAGSTSRCDIYFLEVNWHSRSAAMQYLINLSEESDHLLRQLCDSAHNLQSEAVSPEDFLSAFFEEQLDGLFARRERRKTGKTKKAHRAVRSAKEHAKTWSEAVIATHTAVEAMRKLVAEATMDGKANPDSRSRQ